VSEDAVLLSASRVACLALAVLLTGTSFAADLPPIAAPVLHLAVGWDRDVNLGERTEPASRPRYVEVMEVSENFRVETRHRGSGSTLDAGWHYGLTPSTVFSTGVGSDASDVRLNFGIRHNFSWNSALGGLSR
jgi:hypothetical protein